MSLSDGKIKKSAQRWLRQRPRGACPDEEQIAAFLENKLTEPERLGILSHFSRCPACLELARLTRTTMTESEDESRMRVSLSALARARKLDPAATGLMEVVIRFVRGAAEVVRVSGDVVSGRVASPEHVRGEGRVLSETLVTFTKKFPPYLAEVDVEKTRPDQGEITVKLTDEDRARPASGLRISLFDRDQELESALLEEGAAVFENVKFGQYRLEIAKAGQPIGRVALEMKGE